MCLARGRPGFPLHGCIGAWCIAGHVPAARYGICLQQVLARCLLLCWPSVCRMVSHVPTASLARRLQQAWPGAWTSLTKTSPWICTTGLYQGRWAFRIYGKMFQDFFPTNWWTELLRVERWKNISSFNAKTRALGLIEKLTLQVGCDKQKVLKNIGTRGCALLQYIYMGVRFCYLVITLDSWSYRWDIKWTQVSNIFYTVRLRVAHCVCS